MILLIVLAFVGVAIFLTIISIVLMVICEKKIKNKINEIEEIKQ